MKAIADGVNSAVIETMGFPDDDRQVANLARDPGIDPANVLISIVENRDIDWSFRDGIAPFVP